MKKASISQSTFKHCRSAVKHFKYDYAKCKHCTAHYLVDRSRKLYFVSVGVSSSISQSRAFTRCELRMNIGTSSNIASKLRPACRILQATKIGFQNIAFLGPKLRVGLIKEVPNVSIRIYVRSHFVRPISYANRDLLVVCCATI